MASTINSNLIFIAIASRERQRLEIVAAFVQTKTHETIRRLVRPLETLVDPNANAMVNVIAELNGVTNEVRSLSATSLFASE